MRRIRDDPTSRRNWLTTQQGSPWKPVPRARWKTVRRCTPEPSQPTRSAVAAGIRDDWPCNTPTPPPRGDPGRGPPRVRARLERREPRRIRPPRKPGSSPAPHGLKHGDQPERRRPAPGPAQVKDPRSPARSSPHPGCWADARSRPLAKAPARYPAARPGRPAQRFRPRLRGFALACPRHGGHLGDIFLGHAPSERPANIRPCFSAAPGARWPRYAASGT